MKIKLSLLAAGLLLAACESTMAPAPAPAAPVTENECALDVPNRPAGVQCADTGA
ncbi:hypothetical protein LVO79_08100 [Roseivivax marinus]|jgi:putative hemolysin|uniref:hypothetical protein n=1 Tax=Roseivivax marinus TaxID=1379903 RepID=UPI0004B72A9B|nr:hypothetical protein [Roseivivax marinus]UMA66394.1 hypothetical protein LVO79_08100 [Roseivivax marinus]SEK79289.1 hypothetical protein SAMN05444413_103280 [Roseivivax marinus]